MIREELARLFAFEERHRRLLARLLLTFGPSIVAFVAGTVRHFLYIGGFVLDDEGPSSRPVMGAADGSRLAVPAALAGRKPHPGTGPGRMPGESGGLQVISVLTDRNPAAADLGAETGAKVFHGDDEPSHSSSRSFLRMSTASSCSQRTSAGHPLLRRLNRPRWGCLAAGLWRCSAEWSPPRVRQRSSASCGSAGRAAAARPAGRRA